MSSIDAAVDILIRSFIFVASSLFAATSVDVGNEYNGDGDGGGGAAAATCINRKGEGYNSFLFFVFILWEKIYNNLGDCEIIVIDFCGPWWTKWWSDSP